jgi:hypothetical protein
VSIKFIQKCSELPTVAEHYAILTDESHYDGDGYTKRMDYRVYSTREEWEKELAALARTRAIDTFQGIIVRKARISIEVKVS